MLSGIQVGADMNQKSLATAAGQGAGFEQYRRSTKRAVFLATMCGIVPWRALYEVIEPLYPQRGNGRPPIGLERMLRMYFIGHWFNLADEACEEALLDSTALRRFVGIDLGRERVVTTANVHDKHPLPDLLHGNERRVYGDSAYASQKALIEAKAPRARDFTNQGVRWAAEKTPGHRAKNQSKSRVRARVEHVFALVPRFTR
jgi:hypothetical protein